VRKDVALLVRTSTVAAVELAPAADVAADELEPAADAAGVDDAGAAAPCEPPELQAAARTPAAASGTPNLRTSATFLDNRRLFICCVFSFPVEYRALGECLAPLNTSPPQRPFGRCPMSHVTE
jgi:hypothetical protein